MRSGFYIPSHWGWRRGRSVTHFLSGPVESQQPAANQPTVCSSATGLLASTRKSKAYSRYCTRSRFVATRVLVFEKVVGYCCYLLSESCTRVACYYSSICIIHFISQLVQGRIHSLVHPLCQYTTTMAKPNPSELQYVQHARLLG
jgi:hypothetical protein